MKIILREDQLEKLINSLPDFEEKSYAQDSFDSSDSKDLTCRCQDFSLFYNCKNCMDCCRSHGGPNQDAVAPITGMGSVSYSYSDPGEIATSNSSSSFGYVKPK